MVRYLTNLMNLYINMTKEFKTQLDNFKDYESEGVKTQRLLDNLKVQSPDTKKQNPK